MLQFSLRKKEVFIYHHYYFNDLHDDLRKSYEAKTFYGCNFLEINVRRIASR